MVQVACLLLCSSGAACRKLLADPGPSQIASYLARVHGKSMPRALEMFTKARPPGIYKHYYIRWGGGRCGGEVGCADTASVR